MHRELTVREILDTYAFLRLPAAYTAAERDHVVSDVIDCLQLTHVSDSTIGDEAKRGISGGQRKRVNVGMEMVADPSLLFLDEPTSGLDSTTSFDLVTALKALAAKGCNVITVLHQPSYPLYQMFSSVLLLGKGGKTVYLGPGEHAMTYFNQCGYEMPPLLNPADFYMDVIAGKYGLPPALKLESKKASAKQAEFFNSEGKPGILFDMWDENRGKYEELAMKTFVHAEPILMENVEALEPMGSTNILKSMGKYMQRAAIQHARASDLFIFDMILVMGCGLFLGFSYGVWTLPKLAQKHLFYSLGADSTVESVHGPTRRPGISFVRCCCLVVAEHCQV